MINTQLPALTVSTRQPVAVPAFRVPPAVAYCQQGCRMNFPPVMQTVPGSLADTRTATIVQPHAKSSHSGSVQVLLV